MKAQDAVALLQQAVPQVPGVWADFGAGDGTFTKALAELVGTGSTIYAVDRNANALRSLAQSLGVARVKIVPVTGDFTQPLELPSLDGMLFANALHYAADAEAVLSRLVRLLRGTGQVVIVEYDRRAANRWVPYPITPARLGDIAAAVGLSQPAITATRASRFGGDLYVARLSYLGKGGGARLTPHQNDT